MLKNKFEIIPYTEIDGIRTYKDSAIMKLYDKIISSGYGYMFDGGQINSKEEFLHKMKYENNFLYVLYIDKNIAGIVWLNTFSGKVAHIHYCSYSGFSSRKKINLFRMAFNKIINIKDKNNEYLFDLFLGHIPASNMTAIKFGKGIGAEIVGKVPQMMWNKNKLRSESGYILYYKRGIENE